MNDEELKAIARRCAKAKPRSYYAEPFEPHEWVIDAMREAVATAAGSARTQDPKYDIENGRLVNAATREPIPEDEPIFILRAKDVRSRKAIAKYIVDCTNNAHRYAVQKRLTEFNEFAAEHPESMKEPDTAPLDPRPTKHFMGNEPTGT